MKTAENIKKHITQGDPLVRQFAVQYFSESYSQDPGLMSLVLESCQIPEYTGFNRHVLELAHRFVYTEKAVAKLAETLSAVQEDKQEAYILTQEEQEAYQWLLVHSPFDMLEPYEFQLKDVPEKFREILELRKALSTLSTQELWDKFTETDPDKQAKSHNQIEKVTNELLFKELAFRQELTNEQVPQLVNMLHSKQEAQIERAVEGLVYIGSEEVLERLTEDFTKQSVTYRLAASDILGRIKLAASEMAILRLFPRERDKVVQTNLVKGICQLLSLLQLCFLAVGLFYIFLG